MSDRHVTCPDCDGTRQVMAFFNGGPDISQHSAGMILCRRCAGAGFVTQADIDRMKRGADMRRQRAESGELLGHAAKRLGLTTPQLSAVENGYEDMP